MHHTYQGVTTRFLRPDERLIQSEEKEMPLVLEADEKKDLTFLHQLLKTNSPQIMQDVATYGAVLLRGFAIQTEEDFEQCLCSLPEIQGISEAFMSEEGRIPVGNLQYVLHTNAVYKTGGTLYLGGFHNENYYSADVPAYISFCCFKPSASGGETGLVNMEKIYAELNDSLQAALEKRPFFVGKWLVREVRERYGISTEQVEILCNHFDLSIVGKGENACILLYKPAIFEHPVTGKKSLQTNLFELKTLNATLRKQFIKDYPGKSWFWHRFVWRLPEALLKIPELFYITLASFFYSPKNALKILQTKWQQYKAAWTLPAFDQTCVDSCFQENDISQMAALVRKYYVSCLWQSGDILLVDNRKVMHAGMPGTGKRIIRAMIANPLAMQYSCKAPGKIDCRERAGETVGFYMASGESEQIIVDNKTPASRGKAAKSMDPAT